ncbi:hypothetical protein L1049_022541 [Liquidambar formosana]|uniref:F-box domain-containing protein n=1 Tax=Liquidambar formosana TaxID=63359 RepID=A0AAP0RD42_LIQFO
MAPSKRRRASHNQKSPEQSSATVVSGNEDLLTEILLRLPAQSLLRFKAVSKNWLSLISDHRFSLHWKNFKSVSPNGLFLRRYSRPKNPNYKLEYVPLDGKQQQGKRSRPPFRSLSFVDDPLGIKILQSSHGLLLCSSRVDHPKRNYYVYNPTTKQFRTLPRPTACSLREVCGIYLAFDPFQSKHYKVVCVSSVGSGRYRIEIYSPETGTWVTCGDSFNAPLDLSFRNGVFWNGAIHWPSCWSETSLCFDINRGSLRTMPMPPIQSGQSIRTYRFFGESRGHLHLVEFFGYFTIQFDVFELERDYSKWFIKYRVDLDVVTTAFPEVLRIQPDPLLHRHHCVFLVFSVVRGETENESSLVLYMPGKVISYNLKDKKFKKLCNLVLRQSDVDNLVWHRSPYIHQHIESLFCV